MEWVQEQEGVKGSEGKRRLHLHFLEFSLSPSTRVVPFLSALYLSFLHVFYL